MAIEDLDRRVIVYSSVAGQRIDAIREQGILDRRVPDMDRNVGQYRDVLAADSVWCVSPRRPTNCRAAIAIKAGSQPLGTIWAIESGFGFDPEAERALIDGARLAALKILRSLNADGLDLQLREAALLRALDGSLTAADVAFRLSLPGGAASCHDRVRGHPRQRWRSSPDHPRRSCVVPAHQGVPSGRGNGDHGANGLRAGSGRWRRCGNTIRGRAVAATRQVAPGRIRAGIASMSSDPSDLPAMRHEIDDILRVTIVQPDLPGVARIGDVHTRVLLAHIQDLLLHEPQLRHPGVSSMIAHDIEHGTAYATSVAEWLGAVGDIAGAARVLGVHPNTLRYRLRRAVEIFDCNSIIQTIASRCGHTYGSHTERSGVPHQVSVERCDEVALHRCASIPSLTT